MGLFAIAAPNIMHGTATTQARTTLQTEGMKQIFHKSMFVSVIAPLPQETRKAKAFDTITKRIIEIIFTSSIVINPLPHVSIRELEWMQ
jgi:hypothetical protein